jgi:RNA polymerase sigma factor FliA
MPSVEKGGSGRSAKARADSPEVLHRVESGLSQVDVIAKALHRQLGGRVMFDELVSFGREGLLDAARSFDTGVGVPFLRWASYRIRGAMLDGVRTASMLPRSIYERIRAMEAGQRIAEQASEDGSAQSAASAEEADARLGTYLASIATAVAMGLLATHPYIHGEERLEESPDQAPPADEVLAETEMLAAVREAMETLPDQERHLVQRHYFDDVQLDEAAHEIGLSKSWGSRLHGRALESITRYLKRTKQLG